MIPERSPSIVVGLVGAGGIAPSHLTGWHDLGVDVLVHSVDGADALVAAGGHGSVVADLGELLQRCDIVDICTPTITHPDLVERAVAAGRSVICEKPLALTAARGRELVAAAAAAGVQLLVAHVVRYFAEYAAIQRHVADGGVGTVAVQRFSRRAARPLSGWFADPGQSGGVLLDLMIHDLDIARWLAGDVLEVFARDTGTLADPGAATTTQVMLRHTGGAISQLTGVWGGPDTTFGTSVLVAGDDGLLEHDSGGHPPVTVDGAATGSATIPATPYVESPYTAELRDFLAAITTGTQPRVTAADAVAALEIAEAAAESIATGAPVRLGVGTGTGTGTGIGEAR